MYLDPSVAAVMLRRLGRTPPREDSTALSERESEVMQLIAQGHSNREVAARLEISIKTVETHKARAMEKLGLTSRADIVRYALQQGWLQDSRPPRSTPRGVSGES